MTDIWDYYMDLARAGIDPEDDEYEEPSPAVIESLKQGIAMSFTELLADLIKEKEDTPPPNAWKIFFSSLKSFLHLIFKGVKTKDLMSYIEN